MLWGMFPGIFGWRGGAWTLGAGAGVGDEDIGGWAGDCDSVCPGAVAGGVVEPTDGPVGATALGVASGVVCGTGASFTSIGPACEGSAGAGCAAFGSEFVVSGVGFLAVGSTTGRTWICEGSVVASGIASAEGSLYSSPGLE